MGTYVGTVSNSYQIPQLLDNAADNFVGDGLDRANDYALDAYDRAQSFLDQIVDISAQIAAIPLVNEELEPVLASISPYVDPGAPGAPAFNPAFPTAPTDPALEGVSPLDIGAAPAFTAIAPNVDLDGIPLPSALTANIPSEPSLTPLVIPGEPDFTLPDVPSLISISLPSVPELSLPTFNEAEPDMPDAPSPTISFLEPEYESDLDEALRVKLLAFVSGTHTGLDPEVEQALWDRAREREAAIALATLEQVNTEAASRGFPQPTGAQNIAVLAALQSAQSKISSISRDIAIKQAELEQENRKAAFVNALQHEGLWLTRTNQIAQRAFELAKSTAELAVALFSARISAYNAQVQMFVARASVFKTRIEGELAKLDIYKAQLEGQKLIGELNVQSVQIYRERVAAALSIIELFKARLDAVRVLTEADRNRVEMFRASVGAYEAQVKAKASEYDMYATRIKAEATKVDIFKAQAEVYRALVDGFAAYAQVGIAQLNSEIKVKQEVPLEAFKAKVAAYDTSVKAESGRLQGLATIFESEVKSFSAQVEGEASRVRSETEVYKAEVDAKVSEANLRLQNARINLDTFIKGIDLLIESMKAGAAVAAQLAASALSAVNLSAGVSSSVSTQSSVSASSSHQTQLSNQLSEDHRFTE